MKVVEKSNGSVNSEMQNPKSDVESIDEITCATCPFWHAREDLAPADETAPRGGECRLNPPLVFEVTVDTRIGKTKAFQSVWPISGSMNWCGKHPERDAVARAGMLLDFFEIAASESPGLKKALETLGFTFG